MQADAGIQELSADKIVSIDPPCYYLCTEIMTVQAAWAWSHRTLVEYPALH